MLYTGHFDGHGNYIANKTSEEVSDVWLDSVDWNKVSDTTKIQDEPTEEEDEEEPNIDPLRIKKDIVTLMKPGMLFLNYNVML